MQDWVHSRELVDVDTLDPAVSAQAADGVTSTSLHNNPTTGGAGGVAGSSSRSSAIKVPYIPVPDDPHINTVCPICQEKFEQKWLDEAQEWVWMDAVRIGDRVYHASCHAEATAGVAGAAATRGGTPGASAALGGGLGRSTPDRVLGKRKAEVC
jgi:pre-mRNA cleavage complex 2 protein Pcf11